MQSEVLLLIDLLRLDDPAYEFLYLGYEPNEDEGVDHIEAGVEGSEYEVQFAGIEHEGIYACALLGHRHIVTHDATNRIHEGAKYEQHP